jgi:predicted nucleic acid-binding protein
VTYLLDTNVISEIRRKRPDPSVVDWFEQVDADELRLSVLVLGEIRQGVERLRLRDAASAETIALWLEQLTHRFASQIAPITVEVADLWGRLNVPDRLPAVDGLLAATAIANDWILVTRNVDDVARTGARLLNPFPD